MAHRHHVPERRFRRHRAQHILRSRYCRLHRNDGKDRRIKSSTNRRENLHCPINPIPPAISSLAARTVASLFLSRSTAENYGRHIAYTSYTNDRFTIVNPLSRVNRKLRETQYASPHPLRREIAILCNSRVSCRNYTAEQS